MAKVTAKSFLEELQAFTDQQRQLIEIECSAFSLDPAASERRATQARGDFRFFAQTYFPHYIGSDPSVFHAWVFEKLPQLINGKRGVRVDISAPRGEAKSTLVTQLFVLWCVVTERKHFIPIIMDALDQAEAMLTAIKVELESNPRLAMDFPGVCGEGRVWRSNVLLTANNRKIQAFGTGKRIRGLRHGPHRPDLVVLDDLENDENVQSKAQRDKLEKFVLKAVLPLGPPNGTMDVLYVNTILHYDSVANRLHRNPTWRSVKFRAVLEWPDRMDLWEQWEELFLNEGEEKADLFYTQRQAEMDKGSVVSWPGVRPLLVLMKLRAGDHHAFDCEYQNDPSNDDSAPFKELVYWVHPSRDWVFYGAHDPAMGKKFRKRAHAAILVGGIDRNTGVLDVVEARVAVMVPTLQMEIIIGLQKEYGCMVWGIESVAFQEFFCEQLVTLSRKRRVPVPARGILPVGEKDMRILSLQPHVANGTIRTHRNHHVLNEQLRYYPEADQVDGPDCLHMLFMLATTGIAGIPKIKTGPRRGSEMTYGYGS